MVVVLLLVFLLPSLVQIVSPEFATQLTSGSVLYNAVNSLDILHVTQMLRGLLGT